MNMKKNKMAYIIMSALGLLLIIFGIILFTPFGKKSENHEEETPKVKFVSGIYTNDQNEEIKLYLNDSSCLLYHRDQNNSISLSLTLFNDTLSDKIEEPEITIKTEKQDEIIIESKKENIPSGTFVKKSDYQKEEILKDYFNGEVDLTQPLNGKYNRGDNTLYLFQPTPNWLLIRIDDNNYLNAFDKIEENVFFNSFSEVELRIETDGNNMTITSENEIYNGTYEKEKTFTADDVFKIFVELK